MTEVLKIEGLSAGDGPRPVIDDLDLVIHPGERVGIVGLNGHGKTTLFYAVAGLTGWQRGSILLNGKQIGRTRSQGPGRYTHQIVRQGLAIMPQGDEIFQGLTVEEHLDSGAFTREAWRTRKERKERVLGVFAPLRKLMKTPVGRLSGGERRMVSIGRGLMTDAKLYLADEPTLELRAKNRHRGHGSAAGNRLKRKRDFHRRTERRTTRREGRSHHRHARRQAEGRGLVFPSDFQGTIERPGMDIAFVIINAITVAAIYGLIAIAVSITWSSLGLVNLAYGFIFSFAGYAAWLMAGQVPTNPYLIAGTGIAAGAVAGIIVCLLVFIPLHDKPAFTARGMIATLAISLIGSQLFLMIFGPTSKSLPDLFGRWKVKVFDITLTAEKIGIVLCSIAMIIAVVLWMRSSRRGLEIRAMMTNSHAASIVGIGIWRTGLYVMGLTGAMAGLASVLLSQTYYIAPFSGLTPLIKGVSIALCGGLGSVQGAVIAAVLLGLVEALTNKFLGGQYVLMTQFLVIILVLVVRPRGISGLVDKAREQ